MKQILFSMLLAMVGAFFIGCYYNITPPIYLFIVLGAFALFLQTVLFILRYNEEDDIEITATMKKYENE